ncbi:hypothetical protein H5410_055765 [Solanum commersonii]|uniref:Uncharacterized protein n=1 Tax=Solanum commersonii TaxID=4109 RepID=A0A9J5WK35_SOLCO|nr:hypothetical protein H5410_055765 [Solanum commersonii]
MEAWTLYLIVQSTNRGRIGQQSVKNGIQASGTQGSPSCYHARVTYNHPPLMLQCGNWNITILTSNLRIGGFKQKTLLTG